ncbi:hypothetical protein [uncultured Desulfobacter sp.]|uniref:hypothetical protein n=1 Tax=uncultured Desulfobacter sp. TaxID=240139 RepID=UPI0029F4D269|nr:hypothetical protein [uncultured Desulfobacter sp.]
MYEAAAIGADIKVSEELTAGFEYGTAGGASDIVLLYAAWGFGSGINDEIDDGDRLIK